MNTTRTTLPTLLTLAAFLAAPMVAAAETCPVEIDTPALLTVESASGITLDAATSSRGVVVLEKSPTHLVIAASRPGVLWLETPETCDLQTTLTRAGVRERMIFGPGGKAPASATSFYPLTFATKEEDHEIDPDPDNTLLDERDRPLLTLIHFGDQIPTKEEDHEIDPDPDLQDPAAGCSIPTKEEDHEIDPDPDFQADACGWARDWNATAALVSQLGPGWYFIVRDAEVTQEILIDSRS